MEKSEIREIAKQLAACEYILKTSKDQAETDMALRHMISLALSVPDMEALAEIDECTSAILEGKL